MQNRNLKDVYLYMRSIHTPDDIQRVVLDKQEYTVINGEILRGERPKTLLQQLLAMVIDLQLETTDSVNAISLKKKHTLLIQAILNHNLPLVKILLDQAADPSITDEWGNNAFMIAARCGYGLILKELLSVVREERIKTPASLKESSEPFHSSYLQKKINTNSILIPVSEKEEEKEEKKVSPKKLSIILVPAFRINLSSNALLPTNTQGKTVTDIALDFINTHSDKAKPSFKKSEIQSWSTPKKNPSHLLELVKLATTLQSITAYRLAPAPKPSKVELDIRNTKKEENDKYRNLELANHQKYQHAYHVYDDFYKSGIGFFSKTSRLPKLNDADLSLNLNESKNRFENLPVFFTDLHKVEAAINLFKDYYAPQSAPVPHSLECAGLRRFLTFHWNRHHCKDAKSFYSQLTAKPITNAGDVLNIYDAIEKELQRILGLVHHKENEKLVYNDIINSSYCRRLHYVKKALEKTVAYEYKTQDLSNEQYLYQHNPIKNPFPGE